VLSCNDTVSDADPRTAFDMVPPTNKQVTDSVSVKVCVVALGSTTHLLDRLPKLPAEDSLEVVAEGMAFNDADLIKDGAEHVINQLRHLSTDFEYKYIVFGVGAAAFFPHRRSDEVERGFAEAARDIAFRIASALLDWGVCCLPPRLRHAASAGKPGTTFGAA